MPRERHIGRCASAPALASMNRPRLEGLDASGEAAAWRALADSDPIEVARRAGVEWQRDAGPGPLSGPDVPGGSFLVPSLGQELVVDAASRTISGRTIEGDGLLARLGHHLRVPLLGYLAGSRAVPPTGRLRTPESLGGGRIFGHGSHRLPLDRLAAAYEADRDGFAARAAGLGASKPTAGDPGDLGLVLHPVPLLPVTLVLWGGDEEFPGRASLLFDENAEDVVAVDLLWGFAMYVCEALAED